MATVVALVALRLGLGTHFLYEGVWKVKHADKFSAEPFLTQAKGPAAPLFYKLANDIDGRERLQLVKSVTPDGVLKQWEKARATVEKSLATRFYANGIKVDDQYADYRAVKRELDLKNREIKTYEAETVEQWKVLASKLAQEEKAFDNAFDYAMAQCTVVAQELTAEFDVQCEQLTEEMLAQRAVVIALKAAIAAKEEGAEEKMGPARAKLIELEQALAAAEEARESQVAEKLATIRDSEELKAAEQRIDTTKEAMAAYRDERAGCADCSEGLFTLKADLAEIELRLEPLKKPYDEKLAQFKADTEEAYLGYEAELLALLATDREKLVEYVASIEEGAKENPKVVLDGAGKECLTTIADIETRYREKLVALIETHDTPPEVEKEEPGPLDLVVALVPDLEAEVEVTVVESEIGLAPGRSKYVAKKVKFNGRDLLVVSDAVDSQPFADACDSLLAEVTETYSLSEEQQAKARRLGRLYKQSLRQYLDDYLIEIGTHFATLDRFEKQKAEITNNAPEQKKRDWDKQQELRRDVKVWLSEMDGMAADYRTGLWDLLDADQQAKGRFAEPWTMTRLTDFAVTWGLFAIGLCLILGLGTNFACLGGAAFMFSVILTQPAWPGIYPPAPPVAGHALLINKDFIEMLALLALATTAVGTWGGLDYFLWNKLLKPLCCGKCCGKKDEEEQQPQSPESRKFPPSPADEILSPPADTGKPDVVEIDDPPAADDDEPTEIVVDIPGESEEIFGDPADTSIDDVLNEESQDNNLPEDK
ncbi:MAG: hypothetical protein HQ581_18950 [Planctomycetes bacterium]|nr:hypothetical protein [Planctomycetota bacterium]